MKIQFGSCSCNLEISIRKLIALSISTIFLLVGLEVFLRVGFWLTSRGKDGQTVEKPISKSAHRRVFRVVTLGESTTAPYWDKEVNADTSWPSILSENLKSELGRLGLEIEVQVLNRGKSATSTGFLVDSVSADIEALNPDVIVSMMGINDVSLSRVKDSWIYKQSFLARFIYWSFIYSDCSQCFSLSVTGAKEIDRMKLSRPLSREEARALRLVTSEIEGWDKSDWENPKLKDTLEITISRTVRNSKEESNHLTMLLKHKVAIHIFELVISSSFLNGAELSTEARYAAFNLISDFMRSAMPLIITDFPVEIVYLCYSQQRLNKSCMDDVMAAVSNGLKPNTGLLTVLTYDQKFDDPKFQKIMRSLGWAVDRNRSRLEYTRESYLRLLRLVEAESTRRNRKLVWIAMQYPTGSVRGIVNLMDPNWKEHFPEGASFRDVMLKKSVDETQTKQSDHLYVVSNENFKEKTLEKMNSQQGEGYYFRDYFARSSGLNFGHTTRHGSELIVQNLLEQMRPHWKEIVNATNEQTQRPN